MHRTTIRFFSSRGSRGDESRNQPLPQAVPSAEADAQHREDLAQASFERQVLAQQQSAELMNLLEQNTRLTQLTQELTQRIKELTDEIHSRLTVA